MSNHKPNPNADRASVRADSSQVTVVFSGDLADDDRLWVVACSPTELHNLFLNPVSWVASLGSLPGWTTPIPILTDDFTIVAERAVAGPLDGSILVQGISNTNALTIVVSQASAVAVAIGSFMPLPDPFSPFWEAIALDPDAPNKKKQIDVTVLLDYNRWFGHFEIRNVVDTPEDVATNTARFLVSSLYDPVGYASMLSGLNKQTRVIANGVESEGPSLGIVPPLTLPSLTFYANVEAKGWPNGPGVGDPDPDPTPDPFVCTITGGSYDPTSGNLSNDGGVIKRYGVEDPAGPRFGKNPENSQTF